MNPVAVSWSLCCRATCRRLPRQVFSAGTAASTRFVWPSCYSPQHINRSIQSSAARAMPPKKENAQQNGSVRDDAHQYQAGDTTHRKEDEWKHREPYRIHYDDEDFPVKWRGSCHCGKVTYQLSRDRPLASKYCHCTTCQRLHGVRWRLPLTKTRANIS